jgi:hypothetical protein
MHTMLLTIILHPRNPGTRTVLPKRKVVNSFGLT